MIALSQGDNPSRRPVSRDAQRQARENSRLSIQSFPIDPTCLNDLACLAQLSLTHTSEYRP